MNEPDFAAADLEALRRMAWSRSPFAAHAMRELTRRAYDLPPAAPVESPPPALRTKPAA